VLGVFGWFCYHCKAAWHPNQTCDSARAKRSSNMRTSSLTFSTDSQSRMKC
jgi:E3 ubiquitin-protein ligase RNF19A